jgi:DNA repair protein RadC
MKVYKSTMPEVSIKYKAGHINKVKVTSSADLFQIFKEMFDQDTIEYNESMVVLFMNNANKTLGWTRHTSGGTCYTVVDIKMILAQALLVGANTIALSHNHPSGQLRPSSEDEKITQKLKNACEILQIRLLDHIIIPGDLEGYYSFCDEGKL